MFKRIRLSQPLIYMNKKLTKCKSTIPESNLYPENRKIYKIHERLFSTKKIPKLSKNFSQNSLLDCNNFCKESQTIIPIKKARHSSSFEIKFKQDLNLLSKQNRSNTNLIKVHSLFHRFTKKRQISAFPNINPNKINHESQLINNENNINTLMLNKLIVIKNEKKIKKVKISRNRLPLVKRSDYIDFIEKRNRINFNPNFNSFYTHNLSSTYIIDSITEEQKLKNNKIIKTKKINESYQIYEIESKDVIDSPKMDSLKLIKTIKKLLTNDSKLNQGNFKRESFYDIYVNKVNFIFDGRIFPTMKNNLMNITIDVRKSPEWTRLNYIDNNTMIYLNQLKTKIQREKDERIQKNEIKINLSDVIAKKRNRGSIVEGMERINFINPSFYIENKDVDIDNDEDLYNIEKFFLHKGLSYEVVYLATPKLKNILFYNKFITTDDSIDDIKNINVDNRNVTTRSEVSDFDLYL